MAISENERHQLAMRIFDRLISGESPAQQLATIEKLVSFLSEEQCIALGFAFDMTPIYDKPKPVNPQVFTPSWRDKKYRP